MIITRTPLRISIGGGGTDLPSYYRSRGGMVISAAISKYVFITINPTFTDDYFLKYSALERCASVAEIDHPIIREALRLHDIGPAVEIVSMADIPAGTGLGSSGTFTVGLLRAIYAHRREHVTAGALAEEACHIEIDRLGNAVGKQDQYSAAFGGITCFEFHPDDRVTVTPLAISNETLRDLEEHQLLFFTGYSRAATSILEDQRTRSAMGDESMLDSLDFTKDLGYRIKASLEQGETEKYAALMREHWDWKKRRSPGMTNADIDRWHDVALGAGALGGKLVGAGAGGFLLFYTPEPARLRRAMADEGLQEVRFDFDHDGSTVIMRG